jgi:hypothetical protein
VYRLFNQSIGKKFAQDFDGSRPSAGKLFQVNIASMARRSLKRDSEAGAEVQRTLLFTAAGWLSVG